MIITDLFSSKDACPVCGQTPCNCTHIAEEKVRLDPKCWSGKKIGNPKTKIKGGVRVNNCVPAESVAENYDNGEYSDEAGMAHGNLITIAKAAEGLLDTIDQHEDLPEWVQEKIAKVEGMLVSAWNYLQSQEAQGIDPRVSEMYANLAENWQRVSHRLELNQEFDLIESIVESIADRNGVDAEAVWADLESLTEDELYVFAVTSEPIMEDWKGALAGGIAGNAIGGPGGAVVGAGVGHWLGDKIAAGHDKRNKAHPAYKDGVKAQQDGWNRSENPYGDKDEGWMFAYNAWDQGWKDSKKGLAEDWQKANKKDKTDGMSRKAVKAYRREHPGSKLQTAVTTKPGKLKKGSKASKRRKSYCSRSRGQMKMHNISCAKTPDKAICKARRRWNCEGVEPTQNMLEGEVVPFKRTAPTWQKLPKDVLTLANDWFWTDYEGGGLQATMDPKGLGNGLANQQKYLGAQLQQRGWAIDIDDEFENVVLKNRQGQTILLPIEDAQLFKGWAQDTNPVNEQGVAEGWDSDTTRLEQDVRDALENGDDYTAKQYAKMAPTPEAKKYLLNIIKQAMYIDDLGGETDWKGVAEGADNIGPAIKSLYRKIYRAGDDEIEYFYNDSPVFAQYWDEYEGDLNSIIAEVDPAELQIIYDELKSYVDQANLAEVSDQTLTSYLTKVDADSQKHEKDPTKRSAEKRNKSVAGFARAFNKLDARKEPVNEIDPNNYDSDEDYYRDLEAGRYQGVPKKPYNPDWDADDEEFMQKWYEKHGLEEQGGLGFGENDEKEADYGKSYQDMVKRMGAKAREQERSRPVDIGALARKLRDIEHKDSK